MTAYEKAIALGLSGTDGEIVATLQATGVTTSKIDLSYLMELLNFRGMLRKTDGSGGQERWVGTLQNLKSALVSMNQTDAVTAYETWFSHVTNPRQAHWDTTLPEYAAGFLAMRNSFAGGEGMPTTDDFAAVAGLGGGWLFADLKVEQFEAQRQAADSLAASRQIVAATRQVVTVLSAKATAVNAWCDALDLSTKTPEEVQAYCDSLLASSDGNPA